MAWWDYGYQIGTMANKTTIVDNNTWNNTHIATVGLAMAATEVEVHFLGCMYVCMYVCVCMHVRIVCTNLDNLLWDSCMCSCLFTCMYVSRCICIFN